MRIVKGGLYRSMKLERQISRPLPLVTERGEFPRGETPQDCGLEAETVWRNSKGPDIEPVVLAVGLRAYAGKVWAVLFPAGFAFDNASKIARQISRNFSGSSGGI
jgi:hypothetical protein